MAKAKCTCGHEYDETRYVGCPICMREIVLEISDKHVTTSSKPPSISAQLIAAIQKRAEDIDEEPFGEITLKWQDGKVNHGEVTFKFKP